MRLRIRSSRPLDDPEEHEPVHAQDLDTVTHRLQRALCRRPVDVAVVGLPEGDLAHQLDPPVVDREQDAREHEPDHDAGQEARPMIVARITRTIAYSNGGRVRRMSHTHSTMKARPRKTRTPPTIIRGISSMNAPEHDRRERDERGEEPGGPRVHVHAFGQGSG